MGVFYMFLSESDYDSLCTFPLQLSWGPHSQFFLLADYLLRYICDCICNFSHLQIISALYLWPHFQLSLICRLSPAPYLWPHSHFFSFADYLLRHTCDCIRTFSYLQIIFYSIFVTAFAIFLTCRLSSAPYLWPHSHFFSFADYLLRHTCDCIRTFSYLQIISCSILVTAFTIFLICRLSPAPYLWPHFQLSLICRLSPAPHLPYDCAGDAYRQDYPVVWTRNTRRGLRYEMQASFRHQAHCLSVSEFGQLADNRRMQRVANAAVLQVHTQDLLP